MNLSDKVTRSMARMGCVAGLLVGMIIGASLPLVFWGDKFGHDQIIAARWGDGVYGPAFYGAQVYTRPANGGFSVRARVLIGSGAQGHDCGEIGQAGTFEEAVALWSEIEWRQDGLHLGSEPNRHFVPRATIEDHR